MDITLAYRSLVLAVARSEGVKKLVMTRGKKFSRRFVAGDTLDEALASVDRLEQQGVHAILDLLGEMVASPEAARGFKDQIVALIRALSQKPYPRYVSLKLTQLGLDLSEDLAFQLMQEILQAASGPGCFVRIDMEDSPRVDKTLAVYRKLRETGFGNVGVVLQSYLKRTEKDLESLLPLKPAVRIVKGAYKEPSEAAFQDKRKIDSEYLRIAKRALEEGLYTALATHDPRIISEMKRWTSERGFGTSGFELQMLYGVRRDEQKRLAQEGYTVRAYVPYGTDWYPYLSRRIAERPENLLFVLRSLVQG